jgi:hypothetical protein
MGPCQGYGAIERETRHREVACLWWLMGAATSFLYHLYKPEVFLQGSTLSLAYAQVLSRLR